MKGRGRKEGEKAASRALLRSWADLQSCQNLRCLELAVHYWITSLGVWVSLRHAIRLSRASGDPIEQFVGEEDDQG